MYELLLLLLPTFIMSWLFCELASACDDFTSWTKTQFAGSIFGFIELTAIFVLLFEIDGGKKRK